MAIASTKTLMPLDRWAQLVGMHPLHFNGVELANHSAAVCGEPVFQYAWQAADKIGREEIAQAISYAEDVVHSYLHYKLAPTWISDERHNYRDSHYQKVRTDWGFVLGGGREAKTLIDADAPIVYSDADADTYEETATVTVATTVTEPSEIAVYYPGQDGDDAYEIRPIRVTIAAGVATIVFRREQCVLLTLIEQLMDVRAVDGSDDANFLETVDVYRHYTDVSTPVQYLWNGGCLCGSDPCSHAVQNGCLLVVDSRNGLLETAPSTYSVDDDTFTRVAFSPCRYPDSVRIWYKAGLRTYEREWEHVVAYLAASYLDRPLCNCNSMEKFTVYWAEDMALSTGEQSRRISKDLLENPIGTTRAQIYAWNRIKQGARGMALMNA